ncbi:MAG TPA: ketopantoate reductase C-terminal domain-containing protein [Candidatus Binatia bacterium]|nr:ketopantoate reductase C-terminal domain-containing protein [Candidatus Binatia bacterium]
MPPSGKNGHHFAAGWGRKRGTPMEYDALNGAVIRFGERFRVPVPLNRTLYSLLARLDPANHLSSSA